MGSDMGAKLPLCSSVSNGLSFFPLFKLKYPIFI